MPRQQQRDAEPRQRAELPEYQNFVGEQDVASERLHCSIKCEGGKISWKKFTHFGRRVKDMRLSDSITGRPSEKRNMKNEGVLYGGREGGREGGY